ncbi:toll/interleukin-1 receptor domain-containing protein [Ferrimonas sp.]|uniref:toll/interleukin-1 receptor domain-containing protein n=1 Tax=Ferrimonas sp. TaxID=2080861 RepID=UPI003A8D5A51
MRLFLSYSSRDFPLASAIVQGLDALGHSVWFAPEQIGASRCFATEISAAMKEAEVLLLLASRNSIGDAAHPGSAEVMTEIKMAREKKIPVVPLKVDASLECGGAEGFDYLLKNFQWLDLESMLAMEDHNAIAKLIDAALITGASADTQLFDHQLMEVEKLLRDKHWQKAKALLEALVMPADLRQQQELLKLVALLQSRPIKSLSKQQADWLVGRLTALAQGEHASVALYMLALISQGFYQANAIADATPGVANLKQQAQPLGRLKAKYIKMTDAILADSTAFATNWRY